jgi:hypothetical protein
VDAVIFIQKNHPNRYTRMELIQEDGTPNHTLFS